MSLDEAAVKATLVAMGPDESHREYLKQADGEPHARVCALTFATRAIMQR